MYIDVCGLSRRSETRRRPPRSSAAQAAPIAHPDGGIAQAASRGDWSGSDAKPQPATMKTEGNENQGDATAPSGHRPGDPPATSAGRSHATSARRERQADRQVERIRLHLARVIDQVVREREKRRATRRRAAARPCAPAAEQHEREPAPTTAGSVARRSSSHQQPDERSLERSGSRTAPVDRREAAAKNRGSASRRCSPQRRLVKARTRDSRVDDQAQQNPQADEQQPGVVLDPAPGSCDRPDRSIARRTTIPGSIASPCRSIRERTRCPPRQSPAGCRADHTVR